MNAAGELEREEMLRAYLLGALPAERQEEIDEQLVADGEVHTELLATADDLIHAYLVGGLSPADRERFESHFLASPRRQERLRFVRSLLSAVDSERGDDVLRAPVAPTRTRTARRWSATLPWAAALAVSLGVSVWSLSERRRSELRLVAEHQEQDSLRQRLTAQDERVRELESTLRAASEPLDVVTWTVRADVARGARPAEGFRAAGSWVRLRVLLDHDLRVPAYRASLQTPEEQELLRLGGLRESVTPEGRAVDLMVPTGLLRPGTYVVSIQRDATGPPQELTAATLLVR
jgi:hypothetical protein